LATLAACGSSPSSVPPIPVPAQAAYQPSQIEGDWLLTGGVQNGEIRTVPVERAYVWSFSGSEISMPVHGQLPPEKRLHGRESYRIDNDHLRIGNDRAWLRLRIVALSGDQLQVEPLVAPGAVPFQLTFTRIDRDRVLELRNNQGPDFN
jgi:hypothetical protein